jgi:stage II sporulation protein D
LRWGFCAALLLSISMASCTFGGTAAPARPITWDTKQPQAAPGQLPLESPASRQPESEPPMPSGSSKPVRIRLGASSAPVRLTCTSELSDSTRKLPAGAWVCTVDRGTPSRQVFHVFPKTFPASEKAAIAVYISEWRQRGYKPVEILLGQAFSAANNDVFDNRIVWISIASFDSESQANALAKKLEKENIFAWVRSQRTQEGHGTLTCVAASGERHRFQLPVAFVSTQPIKLQLSGRQESSHTGVLRIDVGADSKLEAYEELPFEDYLMGVLPGEMPPSWPIEALAAQAVAARSVSLATSGTKHELDGFWACSSVHCKVYGGQGVRTARSDQAVEQTKGEVIVHNRSIVPAVFCANCGGWTEDNDTVWSSPPNPVLRAIEDAPVGRAGTRPVSNALAKWLQSPPSAYCRDDAKNFRWKRNFSNDELSVLVGKQQQIGRIKDIVLGDRGAGGRLKWVRIEGDKGNVTFRKELPIRQAFGTLPSALFIIETQKGPKGPERFTFIGAGSGHGVGLCQHGARGMALTGADHKTILRHYFSSTDLGRLR